MPAEALVQDLLKEIGDQVNYTEVDIRKDPETTRKYGVQATPTIILLDKSGKVVKKIVGVPSYGELKSAVDQATK